MKMADEPVLWHIGISHYSEKVRWALAWKGVEHVRKEVPPGAHMAFALWWSRGSMTTRFRAAARRRAHRRLHGDHRCAGGASTRSRRSIRRTQSTAAMPLTSRTTSTTGPRRFGPAVRLAPHAQGQGAARSVTANDLPGPVGGYRARSRRALPRSRRRSRTLRFRVSVRRCGGEGASRRACGRSIASSRSWTAAIIWWAIRSPLPT